MSQIYKLMLKTGEKDESLLELLLEDAQAEILDYTNRTSLTPNMTSLQRELALVYYNRLGSEAESSRSEGGVSVTYSTDIPENLKRRLKSYRLLKVVKCNENKE